MPPMSGMKVRSVGGRQSAGPYSGQHQEASANFCHHDYKSHFYGMQQRGAYYGFEGLFVT
jgi:hypothetical protein